VHCADGGCGQGIPFEGGTNILIEHNTITGNVDDGIEIDNAATTLMRDSADGNGDIGMEAIAGVIDGGGNRAAGTGNPAECMNVACG